MDMQTPPAIVQEVGEALWNTRISRTLSSRRDADILAAAAIKAYEEAKEKYEKSNAR